MPTKTEIVKTIITLPILQRISIIENLLKSVKDDTLKQIENNQLKDVLAFYKIFLLNNETLALHSFVDQITATELPITKGNKKLDPTALFGIWKNKPRNLQDIRQQDWKRNWYL